MALRDMWMARRGLNNKERGNKMTRKDYEVMAKTLKVLKTDPELSLSTLLTVQARFETILKEDNPNFDKAKFSKACSI